MKIGLVRRGYSPTGGAETYLKRFAQEASALGHECLLFATADWPKNEWPYKFKKITHGRSPLEFSLELTTANPARDCEVLFSLERVLACDCYRAGDGVHAAWLQRRSKYESGLRTWWRNRQDKHHELLKIEETMFKGESARVVIANSQMVKDEIVKYFGYPADRIQVIYNGVPRALSPEEAVKARSEVRKELGLNENDYVLLFAGSGWDRKGLRFAVEAVNQIAVTPPTLLVAGSGKPRQMPRSERTKYLGPVRGLSRYLAAADTFILPTLYEPFSNACLEAMAAGLPVITTKANGFAEIIENGVEGEIVEEPSDILALAQAIECWAAADRRNAISDRLREKGTEFSIGRNVRQTLEVLEKLRPPVPVEVEEYTE